MSIVTKTGDDGTTGLYGGSRIRKDSERMHAIGSVDELNAILGVILSDADLPQNLKDALLSTQRILFTVGSDLSTPPERTVEWRIGQSQIDTLEQWITGLETLLPRLQWFILPSGTRAGSELHHARTVCRRAERHVCALKEADEVNPLVQIYLNRLSDFLFLAAREVNRAAGAEEVRV